MLVKKDIPQSVATFGEPGIKRDDPDWYAAYVVNYILGGGGFASRLMTEGARTRPRLWRLYLSRADCATAASSSAGSRPQNGRVAEWIELIRQEWKRMHDDGPTEEELANAKTYLTGSFPTQFDSTGRIAGTIVQLQQDKLGIDFIDSAMP